MNLLIKFLYIISTVIVIGLVITGFLVVVEIIEYDKNDIEIKTYCKDVCIENKYSKFNEYKNCIEQCSDINNNYNSESVTVSI